MVYNDKVLGIQRKKEIKKYKTEIKSIKKKFSKDKRNFNKKKKRDLKNMSIGRALSIINGLKIKKLEKDKKVKELELKIDNISKMSLIQYLKYINENEKDKEIIEENSISTIDEEIEEKLSKLDKIIKENNIKYHMKF